MSKANKNTPEKMKVYQYMGEVYNVFTIYSSEDEKYKLGDFIFKSEKYENGTLKVSALCIKGHLKHESFMDLTINHNHPLQDETHAFCYCYLKSLMKHGLIKTEIRPFEWEDPYSVTSCETIGHHYLYEWNTDLFLNRQTTTKGSKTSQQYTKKKAQEQLDALRRYAETTGVFVDPKIIARYCFLLIKAYGNLNLEFKNADENQLKQNKELRKFKDIKLMIDIGGVPVITDNIKHYIRVEDLGRDICAELFCLPAEEFGDETLTSIFRLNKQIKPKHRLPISPDWEKELDEYQKVRHLKATYNIQQ